MRTQDYIDRQVTRPKQITSPTRGPPPPCKQALTESHTFWPDRKSRAQNLTREGSFENLWFEPWQLSVVNSLTLTAASINNSAQDLFVSFSYFSL